MGLNYKQVFASGSGRHQKSQNLFGSNQITERNDKFLKDLCTTGICAYC
jgi:hypothetical protein